MKQHHKGDKIPIANNAHNVDERLLTDFNIISQQEGCTITRALHISVILLVSFIRSLIASLSDRQTRLGLPDKLTLVFCEGVKFRDYRPGAFQFGVGGIKWFIPQNTYSGSLCL